MTRALQVFIIPCLFMLLVHRPSSAASFDNWENPHVHPLDMTPDGTRLLAANTPDNRLEVFEFVSGTAVHLSSISVGLDPVTVRARSNNEVWVVNHISDSISIVNLASGNVVASLKTLDEPCDVVFAGNPERAFVSCSQVNTIQVFDPNDLAAAPTTIAIDAEEPRAMAVSADQLTVYVAIFESGNRTTILGGGAEPEGFFPPNVVSDPLGPYDGQNPPPNDGLDFNPRQNPANPPPPKSGLIVKKNADGRWRDDNARDWTDLVSGLNADHSGRPVGWDLPDYDLAIINTATLDVNYVSGLMNICMTLALNPATGHVSVAGTDALNEIRFEPNLNGRFARVNLGIVKPDQSEVPLIVDLNSHLTYAVPTVPQSERDKSIGDPRGIVWNGAGTRGYVTGMGSNNLIVIDSTGNRAGIQPTIEVGEGPTGLALDEARNRLYVLNKFAASISVVDTLSEMEVDRVPFHDPTPLPIRIGRKHHYDTHETSGLGHVACGTCHVDARIDRLAWDLGNPAGEMKPFNQNCNFGLDNLGTEQCPDWHPMKGPMVTQTLQDIIGKEPHHWRGDRDGIEEFNQTFPNLQGDDELLTPAEMQQFEDFLASITLPPNPFRSFDNSLPTNLPLPGHFTTGIDLPAGEPLPDGRANRGFEQFVGHHVMAGLDFSCVLCHTTPTGVGTNDVFVGNEFEPFPTGPNGELHHAVVFSPRAETTNITIKIPQLRNLHEKVGFDMLHTTSRAGFGFLHDGSVDSLSRFMSLPAFAFDKGIDDAPDVLVADMVAFMLSFSGSELEQKVRGDLAGPSSRDTHAAVGVQITMHGGNNDDPDVLTLFEQMITEADAEAVGLVAKGIRNDLHRGYVYVGDNLFQADRATEFVSAIDLRSSPAPGSEITFTVVPLDSQVRIGVDRDADGFFDRDELDAGSDPADPCNTPIMAGPNGDADSDGDVDVVDFATFLGCAGGPSVPSDTACRCTFDFDGDDDVDWVDFGRLQVSFTGS